MEYIALYRKYRPKTFDGIYGQDHIVKTLQNQIVSGKVSHAYLFCGTRGTGKTSVAKIFAHAVNCENNQNGNPCGECEVCKLSDANNVDVIEMDAASYTGVDYARDLREKAQYAPVRCKYKIYIIDEVHMLSQNAFNALLKTIEEPPERVIFVLCTTEVHKIPSTILSRCMRFDFRLLPSAMLTDILKKVCKSEKKKATDEALNAIAVAAEGSARDCLSIADRCFALSNGELTYEQVMSVLGVSSRQTLIELADGILEGNAGKILTIANKLINEGKNVGLLARDLSTHFMDILTIKTCENAQKMLLLPTNVYTSMEQSAKSTTVNKLLFAIDRLQKLDSELKYSLSPFALFQASVLTIAISSGEVDAVALERRISRLEQLPHNLTKETTLVIDRSNALSIWKGVKVELEKMQKPVLSGVWTEISPKLEGEYFVIIADETCYNLLQGEYLSTVEELVNRLVGKKVKLVKQNGQAEQVADDKLLALSKNVKIT